MGINKKIVLSIRAWLKIENKEHRHWCNYKKGENVIPSEQRCYHSGFCWYCVDPFCVDIERKDCPNCELNNPKVCKGKTGSQYAPCTCGYGKG